VRAEAQGFRRAVRTAVALNVSMTVTENFKMEVGQVTGSVVVEANSEKVQSSDAQLGRVITMREIDVLPQLGRGPINLAIFQPGVQIDPDDASYSRVNGTRQGSNNTRLDGIDINDAVVPRLGLAHTANNTDSVEEFRVVTAGGKAEYGRSAGAQVIPGLLNYGDVPEIASLIAPRPCLWEVGRNDNLMVRERIGIGARVICAICR